MDRPRPRAGDPMRTTDAGALPSTGGGRARRIQGVDAGHWLSDALLATPATAFSRGVLPFRVMGRLLSLVLGLAVVAFTAYYAINHLAGADRPDPEGRSQPKAVLDNTRAAAKRIENDAQKRADETFKKMDDTR